MPQYRWVFVLAPTVNVKNLKILHMYYVMNNYNDYAKI